LKNERGNDFAKLQVKLVLWNRFLGSLKVSKFGLRVVQELRGFYGIVLVYADE
jgi:hypothetical protein